MVDVNRIVTLIDMDCFYCQVEEKLDPILKGKPIAVVQYNEWKGGGIIAVNYLARAKGVTRHMRGDEAKEKCPDIQLARVPCVRGKADISKYRDAGKDVAHVLQSFTTLLERASIDEAYLDITENVNSRITEFRKSKPINPSLLHNNYVLGYNDVSKFIDDCYSNDITEHEMSGFDQEHSLRLLVGGIIVSEIRSAVFTSTGFTCSAGIATNKIMAKLVCGMNKPNKQTILPKSSIFSMFESIPVTQVKGLGGKYGIYVCEQLNITKMNELCQFSEKDLQKRFDDKNGSWLYLIARGIDTDPVTPRFSSKSIGCCKKFAGKSAILDYASLLHWFKQLGEEIEDRLKADSLENNRHPTQMVVSFTKQLPNGKDVSCSRSLNAQTEDRYCGRILAENSLQLIKKDSKPFFAPEKTQHPQKTEEAPILLAHPIKYLGISVGKFEDTNEKVKIHNFFNQSTKRYESISTPHLMISEGITMDKAIGDSNEATNTSTDACTTEDNTMEDRNNIKATNSKSLAQKESSFLKYFKNVEKLKESTENSVCLINNQSSDRLRSAAMDKTTYASRTKDLPQQESFFIKFFNKFETNQSRCENTSGIPDTLSAQVKINIDDPCSSDDSQCTIEAEINRSHQLSVDKPNCHVPRTTPKRNLFSQRSPGKHESNVCGPLLLDKENDAHGKFTICTKCNTCIPESELPTHIDYHFALSLREEERMPINRIQSITLSSSSKSKPKSSNSVSTKHSITSMFQRINDKVNSEIESNDDNPCKHCMECGKNIKESAFEEHLNYHEAKKIHLEINKQTPVQCSTLNKAKRKRDTKESSKNFKKKNDSTQPISAYFR